MNQLWIVVVIVFLWLLYKFCFKKKTKTYTITKKDLINRISECINETTTRIGYLVNKKTLTVAEAAELCNVTHSVVYNWIRKGKIKAEKIKGRYIVDTTSLITYASGIERYNTKRKLKRK